QVDDMITFTATDTWVMLALLFNRTENGSTLRDLIATADYINHAILTYEELASSLSRLMQAGYVVKQADRYCATSVIRSYYVQTTRSRRAIGKDWQDVEHFLQTTPMTELAPRRAPSRVVSRASYERAVRAYLSSV
ncbi:MAG TPA: hypothetical protein VMP08_05305, partial [Anaerolineae bacterium]|nr:hypothetical protein [Anaerolineae bacterium]